MAERLKEKSPGVMQPWYADDAAMQGGTKEVAATMVELIKAGPMFGYQPEPEKLFVICPLADEVSSRAAFAEENLPVKYCRGHQYIGGVVGS